MSAELKVGQYVTPQVEEVKNSGRVVHLSLNPLAVAQACAESKQGWNLTNLLPGLLLTATIKTVETTSPVAFIRLSYVFPSLYTVRSLSEFVSNITFLIFVAGDKKRLDPGLLVLL